MKASPQSLQGVLWSCPVWHLDIERDKVYIINQVLAFGDFEEIRWLFHTYSKSEIVDVFLHRPIKTYLKEGFYFVRDYVLKLKTSLPETRYVIIPPGATR